MIRCQVNGWRNHYPRLSVHPRFLLILPADASLWKLVGVLKGNMPGTPCITCYARRGTTRCQLNVPGMGTALPRDRHLVIGPIWLEHVNASNP
ncbi:MAG: hypothetical protein U0350_50870 [Caldilineaceae bacterium]